MANRPEKLRTFMEKLEELPYRRFAQLMRSKLDELLHEVDVPYLDQYRGRRIPAMISKLYQVGPQTPRRIAGDHGFDALAPLTVPGQYILPRNNNILVGRDKSFYWCRTAVHGFISSTFTSYQANVAGAFTNDKQAGDIFSSALNENGGASYFENQTRDIAQSNAAPNMGSWSAEMHMYDRSRGRFFSDAPVPMQFFSNGNVGNKALAYRMRLDAGSEIEPRLYLRSFAPARLTENAFYNAASVKGWISVTFIGYQELEDGQDSGMMDTLSDPASTQGDHND